MRPSNVHYRVMLTNHATGDIVFAYMPEQFNLSINSDWEPVLANTLNQGIIGAGVDTARVLFGQIPYDKSLTGQVWRGSEPLNFNLNLTFDAVSSVQRDVTEPVKKLIAWAMPMRVGTNMLRAPGPTIFDQTNRMSMRIGRYLYFDNIILPSVDVTWFTAPDSKGQYIAADVSLSVRTFFTPDRSDIDQYFGLGDSAATDLLYDPVSTARETLGRIGEAINRPSGLFGG